MPNILGLRRHRAAGVLRHTPCLFCSSQKYSTHTILEGFHWNLQKTRNGQQATVRETRSSNVSLSDGGDCCALPCLGSDERCVRPSILLNCRQKPVQNHVLPLDSHQTKSKHPPAPRTARFRGSHSEGRGTPRRKGVKAPSTIPETNGGMS